MFLQPALLHSTIYVQKMENFNFKPIAFFNCNATHPYERRRQSVAQSQITYKDKNSGSKSALEKASIRFLPGLNFEQALQGLQGIDRIWLIFILHQNTGWKPMVRPPGYEQKKGVFATRAPYRPNPIGLSAVDLQEVRDLELIVSNFDLLDGTPILDIKPYLPYCDSFPDSKIGWRKNPPIPIPIQFTTMAQKKLDWLESQGLTQLRGFLYEQLQYNPLDNRHQRVRCLNAENLFEIAYQVWRVQFSLHTDSELSNIQAITVQKIYSAYNSDEINSPEDPHGDKNLHRGFIEFFSK